MNDVVRRLVYAGSKDTPVRGVHFPAPLSRALSAAGYTHVTIRVIDDGILIIPCKPNGEKSTSDIAPLPTSWESPT